MQFLRPDFTYKTGVLQPIGGFSPHAAVMGTVDAFTMQGRSFQAGGTTMPLGGPPVRLMGLRAPKMTTFIRANASPLAKLYTRLVAWGKGHRVVQLHGPGLGGPAGGFFPGGTRPWAAQQVVPGPSQQMLSLLQIAQNYQPTDFAQQNASAISQRSACNGRGGW